MGSFFQKLASVDPIAQSLHLPGSTTYQNNQMQQQQERAEANGLGPYSGQAPSLAGAAAGYVRGGPGAIAGWKPYVYQNQGGILGTMQGAADITRGNFAPSASSSYSVGPTAAQMNANNNVGTAPNPYVAATQKVAAAQPGIGSIQRQASSFGSNIGGY